MNPNQVCVEKYQQLLTLALRMNTDLRKMSDGISVAITTSGFPFSVVDFAEWLAKQAEGDDESK